MKKYWKITPEGFYIRGEEIFLEEKEEVPANFTDVEPITPEGAGMYKPQLINGKVVETATQEEMNPVTPIEPTLADRVADTEATINFLLGI